MACMSYKLNNLIFKHWDRFPQRATANCFANVGFILHAAEKILYEVGLPLEKWLRLQGDTDDDDNLFLAEWIRNISVIN